MTVEAKREANLTKFVSVISIFSLILIY